MTKKAYDEIVAKVVAISAVIGKPLPIIDNGKLAMLSLRCPDCSNAALDDQESNINLLFDFSDQSFHCPSCEEDFDAEDIAKSLATLCDSIQSALGDWATILPLLVVEDKKE